MFSKRRVKTDRHKWDVFKTYFFQETGFDMSCKLSPMKTIYIKCQIPFPTYFSQKTGFNILCKLSPLDIADNLHEISNPAF